MRREKTIRKMVVEFFLVLMIVVGLFTGKIPGTALKAEAADSYKVFIWVPCLLSTIGSSYEPTYSSIQEYYVSMTDVSVTVVVHSGYSLSSADLEGVQLVYLIQDGPDSCLPSEISLVRYSNVDILKSYVNNGGIIVINGENAEHFSRGNAALSALAEQIGAGFTITEVNSEEHELIFNMTDKPALVEGCEGLYPHYYAHIRSTDPEKAVWLMKDKDDVVFAVDQEAGRGHIIAISDINWYYTASTTTAKRAASRFLKNILLESAHNIEEVKNPTIIAGPDDLNWCYGDDTARTLSITAKSNNEGTLSYQWYKSNSESFAADSETIIGGAVESSYSIPSPGTIPLGSYYYKCIVTNEKDGERNSITSKVAIVSVWPIPQPNIEAQPEDITWCYGDPTSRALSIGATSPDGDALFYEWYKGTTPDFTPNGENKIGETTETSYSIDSPETVDIGEYYYKCKVTNKRGEDSAYVVSRAAKVTVLELPTPTITAQPEDLTWYYGDDTDRELSVTVTEPSVGTLSYQWHKGSTAGFTPSTSNAVEGATGARYSFEHPETVAVGKYYYKCVVKNKYEGASTSTTSSAATVTVERFPAPTITTFIGGASWSYYDYSGQYIYCNATSPTGDTLTFQWHKGSTVDFTPTDSNIVEGATNAINRFETESPNTMPVGTYYYKCVITNTRGSSKTSVTSSGIFVRVLEFDSPYITQQPKDLTWYYGDTTPRVLSIKLSSYPAGPFTYQWYEGDTDDFVPGADTIIDGATEISYSIPSPDTRPVGIKYYKCVVTRKKDEIVAIATSMAGTVTVLEAPPRIISGPDNLEWIYGDDTPRELSISVESVAGWTVSYQWHKSATATFTPSGTTKITDAEDASYTIPSPETIDVGSRYYKCVVTRTKGTEISETISDTATVTVKEMPPPVITGPGNLEWIYGDDTEEILSVTATSPNGGTLTYQWHEGTTDAFTPSTSTAIDSATSASYTIPDPETKAVGKHYYKCVVTNNKGARRVSDTSEVAIVTVKELPPPVIAGPSDLEWVYGDETEQVLSIAATSPNGGTLLYQWHRGDTATFTPSTSTALGSATSASYIITDSETMDVGRYYYKCVVTNKKGERGVSATSNVAIATVLELPPPDITGPNNLEWIYGDDTERVLAVSATSPNGGTLHYQWHQGDTAAFTPDTSNVIGSATSASYTIPDPETVDVGIYYYKCVVTNEKGTRSVPATSSVAVVTVKELPPPVVNGPENVEWVYGDDTERVLSVTATAQVGATLTYQWYKGDSDSFTPEDENKIDGANEAGYQIPDPETMEVGMYYYRCIVTATKGTKSASATSKVAIATVKELPPPVITGPKNLSWIYGDDTKQALSIEIAANNGATLSYQWYRGDSVTFTPGEVNRIEGATEDSYLIPSPEYMDVGNYYYSCIVTATKGTKIVSATSRTATVTVLPVPPEEGEITTDIKKNENAPDSTVKGIDEDLAWGIATDSEKNQIEHNGVNAKLWLEITNIDQTVSAGDKQLVENAAAGIDNATVGTYIDLSMFFQVGDGEARKITELPGKGFSIEMKVPTNLRATSGNKRTFYLLSAHGDTVTRHGSTTTDTLSATVNQLSTFAIIYADEIPKSSPPKAERPKPATPQEKVFKASVEIKQTKKKIIIRWGKIQGVAKVEVYATYCKTRYPAQPNITTTKRNVTLKKINGKNIDTKRTYKMCIIAYDKTGEIIGKTLDIHVAGKDCKEATNPKSLKLSKNNVTLRKGQSVKIKAKIKLQDKKKKELDNTHCARFRYVSSNLDIATVDKKGNITGVSPGTCEVYVVCRNGLSKKVIVTVVTE